MRLLSFLILLIYSSNSFSELSEKEKFLNQYRKKENVVGANSKENITQLELEEKEAKRKALLLELQNNPDFEVIGAENLSLETLENIKNSVNKNGLLDEEKKERHLKKIEEFNKRNKNNEISVNTDTEAEVDSFTEVDSELTNRLPISSVISQSDLDDPMSIPPEKVEAFLASSYRQNSREESIKSLTERLKGKPIVSHPKFVIFMDNLIREPNALSDAMGVVKDKSKIGIYVGFLVATFFLGILFKKVQAAKEATGMKRFTDSIIRFVVMNGLRIGIFVFFFGEYLNKTFKVFVRSFF